MCLLAELYLCMSQPERAIAIINSLEKVIFTKKEGEESSPGDSMTDRQIEEWRLKIALVSILISKYYIIFCLLAFQLKGVLIFFCR